MSGIQPKKGQCKDCEPGPHKYLTAGRCGFHYWKHRKAIKDADRKAKGLDVDKQAQKKALDLWYASQISKMPGCCENCSAPLILFAPWAAKAYIAHIVPKRNFESVMIHPLNRVYLCGQCHTNFDNWGSDKVKLMPVMVIAIERFMQFKNTIHPDECRYLPDYFIDLAYEKLNEV
jgi:hypothetical protein